MHWGWRRNHMRKTVSAHVYNTIERYPQIIKTPKIEKAMGNLKCRMALGVNRGLDNSSMCFQKHVTYFLMDVFVLSSWLLRIRRIRIWSSQWLRSDAVLQVWSLKMWEQPIPSLWLGLALPCLNSSMVLAHFEKFVLEKQRQCRHWALGSCLPKATWMCRCCLASKGKLLLFRQRESVAIG